MLRPTVGAKELKAEASLYSCLGFAAIYAADCTGSGTTAVAEVAGLLLPISIFVGAFGPVNIAPAAGAAGPSKPPGWSTPP